MTDPTTKGTNMEQKASYILTSTGLSVYYQGRSYVISEGHANYAQVKQALISREYDRLPDLLDVVGAMIKWLAQDGRFAIQDGIVVYDGEPASPALSGKILRMMGDGWDPSPLLASLEKVRQNPSASAQRELHLFLEASGMPIYDDGDFVAYKAVGEDYFDLHSHTIDNRPPGPGDPPKVIEMPRGGVDDRRDMTCSFGLHFATFDYANIFGPAARHVVVLKINPRDVVSIPSDYNNKKGRCCRYEIIGERLDFTPLPQAEVYTSGGEPASPNSLDAFRDYFTGSKDDDDARYDYDGDDDDHDDEDDEDAQSEELEAEIDGVDDAIEAKERELDELRRQPYEQVYAVIGGREQELDDLRRRRRGLESERQ